MILSLFGVCDQSSEDLEILTRLWKNLQGARSSSSGPPPDISDPVSESLTFLSSLGGFKVKIKRTIRKKDLFRFLLAKMFYEEEEGLHLDEFIVLTEVYFQLRDLQEKDPSFRDKYSSFFERSKTFFKLLWSSLEFPLRIKRDSVEEYGLMQVLEPLLPTKFAYFGLKGQKDLRSGFSIVFDREIPRQKVKEKSVIGVEYRDKGSRRDPALDGSPDWREVAKDSVERSLRQQEKEQEKSRDDPDFDWSEQEKEGKGR